MLLYLDKNKEKTRLSLDFAQFVYECFLCNLPNFSKNSLIFRFSLHVSRIFCDFSFDVVLFFDFCAKKSLRITHSDTETFVLERFGNLPSGKLPIKKIGIISVIRRLCHANSHWGEEDVYSDNTNQYNNRDNLAILPRCQIDLSLIHI